MPEISVVIAAYNARHFIDRAIDSALGQTVPVREVLIVDDASTDDTRAHVMARSNVDATIKVVALDQNGGPSIARNAALDVAVGEWVAVLDADDALAPTYFRDIFAAIDVDQADIILSNFRFYDAIQGRPLSPGLAENVPSLPITLEDYLRQARPYAEDADWGLMQPLFRRDFLNRHMLRYPANSRHGEDFLLMIYSFLAGGRCVISRKAGYLYTSRESGLSRTRIDYPLMRSHATQLMQDKRIAQNGRLVSLLNKRATAIKCLESEKLFWSRRSGGLKDLIAESVVNPRYVQMLAMKNTSRVKRKLRRVFS